MLLNLLAAMNILLAPIPYYWHLLSDGACVLSSAAKGTFKDKDNTKIMHYFNNKSHLFETENADQEGCHSNLPLQNLF